MYEGETLSQMFKRTKKCCAKLLRKISFTTSTPSRASIRLGGDQSARYKQQKNRPEQSEASPPNSSRRSRQSSRSSNKHVTASSFSEDVSHDEDECPSFRISPKFFTGRGTSYVRVEDTTSVQDDCCTSSKTNSSQLMGSVLGKYITKQPGNSAVEKASNNSARGDGGGDDIVLTDKKIYLGMNGVSGQSTGVCQPGSKSPPVRVSNGSTWGGQKNETTTSFIVAQNLMEKFDSCLNLAAQNLRNTLSPRISIYNGRTENSGNFYHTIEFDILKEDTSDSFSCQLDCDDYSFEQVVFEKVKYDKNKKYLRHTPSSSSTGSSNSSPKSTSCPHNGSRGGTLVSIERMHSTFSLDDSLLIEEFPPGNLPATDQKCNANTPGGGGAGDPNGNVQYDLQGNRHISSLPNRHFIQCDGNGNSYDSGGDRGSGSLFDDPWDMFDNKVNQARDKRLLLLRREEATTIKGSPKSSSTTLETWVDDEMFDNSFNEELERRYIPIDR